MNRTKRYTLLYIVYVTLCLTLYAQPKHELRAVWLTTVGGIDWPHSYAQSAASAETQRQELRNLLDLLQKANVNTVLYQARIRGTVTYPSQYEPWDGCLSGRPGTSPGYDPLQLVIDECHKRGMELHAWVVTIPIGKWDGPGAKNLRQRHPTMVKRIGADAFLNPESPMTPYYLADICEEITSRYDIDGIHLDYIRYPETWNITVSRPQGRDYISRIVREIHHRVKQLKPWVKMSCSPIGKHEDLSRFTSNGWNAYHRVCQDAQGWLCEGLMDALHPMMYFDGKGYYPFAADWSENTYGRHVSSGLGIYRLLRSEGNWPIEAIERQLNVSRQLGLGHTYFRSKFLTDNTKGLYDLVCRFDAYPALVPPMTWSRQPAPTPPTTLTVERTEQGDNLTWDGATDPSNGDYLTYNVYASATFPVDVMDSRHLLAIRQSGHTLSVRRHSDQPPLYYAVTAVNRYNMESEPKEEHTTPAVSDFLLFCDGHSLELPHPNHAGKAEYVAVYSMQQNIVATKPYTDVADVTEIPEGIYELRSLNHDGVTHHLGFFIIRRS